MTVTQTKTRAVGTIRMGSHEILFKGESAVMRDDTRVFSLVAWVEGDAAHQDRDGMCLAGEVQHLLWGMLCLWCL